MSGASSPVATLARAALRRVVGAVAVAWFVTTATFAMVAAIPADPVRALVGPRADAATVARARARYCLDRPLLARYGCFVGGLARGDLGESFRTGRPVASVLAERVGPTAELALAALALQLAVGVPLGVLAARRAGRWPDRAVEAAAVLAQSAPPMLVGSAAIYLASYRLGWLPTGGRGGPGWDRLAHLALPAATLALAGAAASARALRAELRGALAADFCRAARARGLGERAVAWRHALPVAAGPLVAMAGVDLGALLGGAAIVEATFAWPGLGRELVVAVLELDLPLLIGAVLAGALAAVAGGLVADLVHLWLDPRLRDG